MKSFKTLLASVTLLLSTNVFANTEICTGKEIYLMSGKHEMFMADGDNVKPYFDKIPEYTFIDSELQDETIITKNVDMGYGVTEIHIQGEYGDFTPYMKRFKDKFVLKFGEDNRLILKGTCVTK
ncbi:hypothetical protein [Vibrio sp. ER1A]|uniref:hypothetical protein n=1 Tax=Vibrio sp. ER1A TaxID=1517681 RepID=UPI0004DD7BC8|nr:hypothetical protein [Vibrio sp. ER1A]KFA99238.1 hypothetical protein HW45_05010 [Vibrio sp. ER1A]